MSRKRITIDNKYKLEIITFVDKCYKTNKSEYKRRGQSDESKIKKDMYYGKLAEYAVWLMYSEMGHECTKPDIAVYKARNKSFDADLVVNDTHNLHVKNQLLSQAQRFGLSWMFQKNDPLVKNPLYSDYVVFTVTASPNDVLVYEPKKAMHLLDAYTYPKKKELRKTKLTIYGKRIGIELGGNFAISLT